ncbi:MAG: hypothetical protein ABSE86_33560 [Bryobacteraceae bacterium]|jgi:hypothetical protein
MYRSGIWKRLTTVAVMLLASSAVARASAVIALTPPDGVIPGAPGSTVGWGFSLTNGADWVSIDSVTTENETSPLGGVSGGFTSYMDLLGGLSNGVTPPGKTWTLDFSPGSPGTGLGQYSIDPGTPPGASDSGDFVIFYDEFSADPNTCGSCYIDTLQLFDSNGSAPAFTINASASPVPEPKLTMLIILGFAVLGFFYRILPSRLYSPRAFFSTGTSCSASFHNVKNLYDGRCLTLKLLVPIGKLQH